MCVPEDNIPELLNGNWGLSVWTETGFSFAGVIAPPDTNHDGVPDYRDKCQGTLPNVAVNTEGCSIDQLCPCEGPWKNHAEYVRCVRSATIQFFTNGIITEAQASRAVRLAISHDCGKRDGTLFPLAVPFAPHSDLPDDAWVCGYADFGLEINGANQNSASEHRVYDFGMDVC